MTTARPPIWVYVSVALTIAFSCLSLSYRYRVEHQNEAVAIIAEADVIADLASAEQMSYVEALHRLKAAGLGGVAITEETVANLMARDELRLVNERDGKLALAGEKSTDGALERSIKGIRTRFPGAPMPVTDYTESTATALVPVSRAQCREITVGLNPEEVGGARAEGLLIVGRYANVLGSNPGYIGRLIAWARDQGVTYFLPLGDQVLGRRENLKVTAAELEEQGIRYCSPEFAKLGGDQNMLEIAPRNVIRLHAAQSAELDKMPFSEAVDRYVRAAKERNMRLLMLRPITFAGAAPLAEFAKFVHAVQSGVVKEGLTMAQPHPFNDSNVPSWVSLAVGLAATPVLCWTVAQFLGGWMCLATQILILVLGLACFKDQARPWMGLIAGTTLPIFSFITLERRTYTNWLFALFSMSVISLAGGLAIAGLHNNITYFIRADQFAGVKLAHFAPIAIIGLYLLWRMTPVKELLQGAITWNQALIGMVVLIAIALMASRTGNDNPAAVSGFELKLRSMLDALLFVRPRTKEFLIGHPFLIVGIGLLLRRHKGLPTWNSGWIVLLLTLGAIGQTSIVNTLCHFHTTLTLSLARIGVGLIAGCILGAILWAGVQRMQPGSES